MMIVALVLRTDDVSVQFALCNAFFVPTSQSCDLSSNQTRFQWLGLLSKHYHTTCFAVFQAYFRINRNFYLKIRSRKNQSFLNPQHLDSGCKFILAMFYLNIKHRNMFPKKHVRKMSTNQHEVYETNSASKCLNGQAGQPLIHTLWETQNYMKVAVR